MDEKLLIAEMRQPERFKTGDQDQPALAWDST